MLFNCLVYLSNISSTRRQYQIRMNHVMNHDMHVISKTYKCYFQNTFFLKGIHREKV